MMGLDPQQVLTTWTPLQSIARLVFSINKKMIMITFSYQAYKYHLNPL